MYGNLDPAMMSVSHSLSASCDGAVPRRPIPPVVFGARSGTTALPSNGFTIGPATISDRASTSFLAPRQPRPARIATFAPRLIASAALCRADCGGSGYATADASELWVGIFALDRW